LVFLNNLTGKVSPIKDITRSTPYNKDSVLKVPYIILENGEGFPLFPYSSRIKMQNYLLELKSVLLEFQKENLITIFTNSIKISSEYALLPIHPLDCGPGDYLIENLKIKPNQGYSYDLYLIIYREILGDTVRMKLWADNKILNRDIKITSFHTTYSLFKIPEK
jgi:hypothetical protein